MRQVRTRPIFSDRTIPLASRICRTARTGREHGGDLGGARYDRWSSKVQRGLREQMANRGVRLYLARDFDKILNHSINLQVVPEEVPRATLARGEARKPRPRVGPSREGATIVSKKSGTCRSGGGSFVAH